MSLWGKLRSALGSGGTETKLAAPQASSSPPRSRESAIRQAFPAATIRRHPEAFGFLVARPGDHEQSIFLDNVFAETRDLNPEQRRERIARFVRSMDTPDATEMSWDEVRPKLVPLLRTPTLFGGVPGFVGATLPIRRPLCAVPHRVRGGRLG